MPQVRFIGLDVHKKKIAVAIAEEGRNGEVLSYGSIENTKAALAKLLQKLGKESATLQKGRDKNYAPNLIAQDISNCVITHRARRSGTH
jgi:hypothetical protein